MTQTIYFGTQTARLAKGIYQANFDQVSGQISQIRLLAAVEKPSYLTRRREDELLAIIKEGQEAGIALLTTDGQIKTKLLEDGVPACYIAFDQERQLVYTANYHEGQIRTYGFTATHQLEKRDQITRSGSGPHPHQDKAHPHFANLTPDGYLLVCDLGTDELTSYHVSDFGHLEDLATYQTRPGAGPRHLLFHSSLPLAYLICELDATIEVLHYLGQGQFQKVQVISTLPPNFTDFNACAAIRLSSDGRHLYASNRGHDSIACYQVIEDGSLELVEIVASQGQSPRDFTLSPNEAFLLVGHQDSDNITVFKRDSTSGKLQVISQDKIVPEAICLLF